MFVFWLFDTSGWIFGPALLLAGIVAMVLCVRASTWARNARAMRAALMAATVPFLVSLCGLVVGLAVWWTAEQAAGDPLTVWLALGKMCLVGLLFTSVPLVWVLLLLRGQRSPVS